MSGSYIQQRGEKKFDVYAYAGVNPASGRPVHKYFGRFRSRRDAERFRADLAHHPLYSATVGPAGSPRFHVEQYISTWIDQPEAPGKLRPHTASGYRERPRLDIFPTLGHVPIARLSPPMIQALYTRLIRERGLVPATVRQAASILHASLRDAVKMGMIHEEPGGQCDSAGDP